MSSPTTLNGELLMVVDIRERSQVAFTLSISWDQYDKLRSKGAPARAGRSAVKIKVWTPIELVNLAATLSSSEGSSSSQTKLPSSFAEAYKALQSVLGQDIRLSTDVPGFKVLVRGESIEVELGRGGVIEVPIVGQRRAKDHWRKIDFTVDPPASWLSSDNGSGPSTSGSSSGPSRLAAHEAVADKENVNSVVPKREPDRAVIKKRKLALTDSNDSNTSSSGELISTAPPPAKNQKGKNKADLGPTDSGVDAARPEPNQEANDALAAGAAKSKKRRRGSKKKKTPAAAETVRQMSETVVVARPDVDGPQDAAAQLSEADNARDVPPAIVRRRLRQQAEAEVEPLQQMQLAEEREKIRAEESRRAAQAKEQAVRQSKQVEAGLKVTGGRVPFIYSSLDELGANDRGPRAKRSANIIATVRDVQHTRSANRGWDSRYDINVQDPSRWDSDDFTKISIFYSQSLTLPEGLGRGSVILLRDVNFVTSPTGTLTGQIASRQSWSAAFLVTAPGESEPEFVLGDPLTGDHVPMTPPFGNAEERKMLELYQWHQVVVAAAEPSFRRDGPVPRKLITMEEMRAGVFCDLVVEVVEVHRGRHMGIAEVYVADYTLNREITSSRHRFGPGLETGMITEITFFDGNVEGVESLKRGDIIYLKNVLVHSRQGSLQGRLKFEGKDGPSKLDGRKTWSILPRDHSHAMKLARRREASIGRVNRGEPYQPMPEQEDVPLGMPTTVSKTFKTQHDKQPLSTIAEIKANRTVPNRFRLQAKVTGIEPGNWKEYVIKWCRTCQASFRGWFCEQCQDTYKSNAEFRYRFAAIVTQSAQPRDEDKLPIWVGEPHVTNLYSHAVMNSGNTRDPLDAASATYQVAHSVLATEFLGRKIDGERQAQLIDWSIESYWATNGHERVRMFRAFDMQRVEQR